MYYFVLLFKHQWNTKWAFPRKLYTFTREDNMLSSHVERSPSLWLHNKSRLWKQADLVFHWCLFNTQNITYLLMDMNFTFSCSTRYLTRSLCSLVRYRVDHSKIKLISTHGNVISSIYISKCTTFLHQVVTNCAAPCSELSLKKCTGLFRALILGSISYLRLSIGKQLNGLLPVIKFQTYLS